VLAGWLSHVADRPPSLACTDFKLRIPCYHLLESVPVKQTRERLQSEAYFGGISIFLVIS
jgi:hypothetical protein